MNILVVDDDAIQRELLAGFLGKNGFSVFTAPEGETALELFERRHIHLALLDHRMPGITGEQILKEMKALNPGVRAIMITAYGDVTTAVEAMKLGADEFLEKPVDLARLLEKIRQLEIEVGVEEDVEAVKGRAVEEPLPMALVAESKAMKEILSMARRVAASPWAVLISGESGTGKEVVARLIHLLSGRRNGPFVDLNCAAIPENLFESELFGHEKGAFTGAATQRRGRFEQADEGTLFLDEIGEMPLPLQPKLLRVLQEQQVTRLASEKAVPVDVRLISATNRPLKQMVDEGAFREDLFYRLKVIEIALPPLRERREDIPALLDLFLNRYAPGRGRFSAEALDAVIKYPFPGNVRELEHMVQRTATLARGTLFQISDLPEEIQHHRLAYSGTLNERLENLEKTMIQAALREAEWVQTQAAQKLGISERVLRYKMKKYAIRKA